jgi:hypothetical protein
MKAVYKPLFYNTEKHVQWLQFYLVEGQLELSCGWRIDKKKNVLQVEFDTIFSHFKIP